MGQWVHGFGKGYKNIEMETTIKKRTAIILKYRRSFFLSLIVFYLARSGPDSRALWIYQTRYGSIPLSNIW
jgi:hypothetical protein